MPRVIPGFPSALAICAPCPPGLVRGDRTFAQELGEQLRGGQREKLSFPSHSWREERRTRQA